MVVHLGWADRTMSNRRRRRQRVAVDDLHGGRAAVTRVRVDDLLARHAAARLNIGAKAGTDGKPTGRSRGWHV